MLGPAHDNEIRGQEWPRAELVFPDVAIVEVRKISYETLYLYTSYFGWNSIISFNSFTSNISVVVSVSDMLLE